MPFSPFFLPESSKEFKNFELFEQLLHFPYPKTNENHLQNK